MISALCALERFLVPFVQELIKYICHMLRTNVDETSNGKKTWQNCYFPRIWIQKIDNSDDYETQNISVKYSKKAY